MSIASSKPRKQITLDKLERQKKGPNDVMLMNKNDQIMITRCKDKEPEEHRKYFTQMNDKFKNGLSVVIPFYNEPAWELCETLKSMYDSYEHLINHSQPWAHKSFNVCIIQDGMYLKHKKL